jgi:PASTA domain
VRVGSPLTASFEPIHFSQEQVVTLAQLDLPEKDANIRSPVDGTVVSYQVAPSSGTFAIQVLRNLTGDRVASIRSSPATPLNVAGISAPIPTSLGIRRGDLIGIRDFAVGDVLDGANNGATYAAWGPPLEDGAVSREPSFAAKGYEIGLGATVSYCQVPKLKGLSLKAARAALAAADCKVGKVTKAKKTRKHKVVVSQSVAPGKAVSDTAPIALKVSRRQRG